MRPVDNYFLFKEDTVRESLLFLREYILTFDDGITEVWKYGMPFYCYRDKMFCYLWTNKKTGEPYLGIVDGNLINHPALLQEKRNRMKILPIALNSEIPVRLIHDILLTAMQLRRNV